MLVFQKGVQYFAYHDQCGRIALLQFSGDLVLDQPFPVDIRCIQQEIVQVLFQSIRNPYQHAKGDSGLRDLDATDIVVGTANQASQPGLGHVFFAVDQLDPLADLYIIGCICCIFIPSSPLVADEDIINEILI